MCTKTTAACGKTVDFKTAFEAPILFTYTSHKFKCTQSVVTFAITLLRGFPQREVIKNDDRPIFYKFETKFAGIN